MDKELKKVLNQLLGQCTILAVEMEVMCQFLSKEDQKKWLTTVHRICHTKGIDTASGMKIGE